MTLPAYIPVRLIVLYMFIFAHLICGLLLGLGFCCLTHDRRAIPLCMVFSLIPDVIDKPLGIFIPALVYGRTVFHSLLIVLIAAIIVLVILQHRHLRFGIAVVGCIFVHQLLDAMWQLPVIWVYPLFGPFPLVTPPDYTGYYLWSEITTPSEWVFLMATMVMVNRVFSTGHGMPDRWYSLWKVTIVLLAAMGIILAGAALSGAYNTFFAPSYSGVTTCMAGILALAAAGVMLQWHRLKPCDNEN